ncbi:hypothetical protein HPB52_013567 [Rhipicephalus sanguineus]|uniref:Uncharacterized protein n=1 Tax=Rhipicephalus sanguineus TaxID=34632 RepID=A0A9D4T4E2_RHISA|nr:hypothetical protein HPB52_013567 [Rhipicephalus sanguineus]
MAGAGAAIVVRDSGGGTAVAATGSGAAAIDTATTSVVAATEIVAQGARVQMYAECCAEEFPAKYHEEGWRGFPRSNVRAQGHNSLPPEPVCRRLQFVAEPLEFDAATLRLQTSSPQVTAPQPRRLRH